MVWGIFKKDSISDTYKKMQDTSKEVKEVNEDIEQIDEIKMADLPVRKVQGRAYGASKPEPHWSAGLKGPKDAELKNIEAEKKKKEACLFLQLIPSLHFKSLCCKLN
mgnify:CR=1 FL=1